MATSSQKQSQVKSPWDHSAHNPVNTGCVATIVLGGGRGTRLFPLTASRCKPATPFGGRYCLIDVPIANSLNSHMDKIFILTQFLSSSLHKHVHRTYRFDSIGSGFVELLAPEEKPSGRNWFLGTADAVRQHIDIFREVPVDYFLILSGDQLYRMDYTDLLYFATQKDADLVVATLPVDGNTAQRMGIMNIDKDARITEFAEKPSTAEELERLATPDQVLSAMGINHEGGQNYLANMGIYLFKRQALLDLLTQVGEEDFGKHLIPAQVAKGKTFAFLHEGYWEDIGTIEAFYDANMALTKCDPVFDCYDESQPLHSHLPCLPGPKICGATVIDSIISSGCVIKAKEITNSIIGPRCHIGKGTVIQASYLMGNDFFSPKAHYSSVLPESFEIGENCVIRKAIIDKNVRLGRDVQLVNKEGLSHYDGDKVYIREGIIVVAKGADIPDGFVL